MSVVRIFSPRCGSYGYQARAHVRKGLPALTRFFADAQHGGQARALSKALWHEARLKAAARRIRGEK